jgi:hypothetical protein
MSPRAWTTAEAGRGWCSRGPRWFAVHNGKPRLEMPEETRLHQAQAEAMAPSI